MSPLTGRAPAETPPGAQEGAPELLHTVVLFPPHPTGTLIPDVATVRAFNLPLSPREANEKSKSKLIRVTEKGPRSSQWAMEREAHRQKWLCPELVGGQGADPRRLKAQRA